MAEFDSVSKSLVSTYPQGVLEFLLGQADVQVLDLLNTEQATFDTQIMDSLLRVQKDGKEALVHCEFQTDDSTHLPMPRRMVRYMGRCIAEYGLPLLAHVIYLRPEAGRRDPGHYVQEDAGYEVVMRYKVIRLIELDGVAHLSSGNPGVLPFTPLMGRPAGVDVDAWLGWCVDATEGLSVSRSARDKVLAHMGVLSSLVCEESTIYSLISEEIMNRFPLIESFLKRGIEQGIEQGIERSIQRVLAGRFGEDMAQVLANRLEGLDDVDKLEALLDAAVQVSDLADFVRLLDQMTAT